MVGTATHYVPHETGSMAASGGSLRRCRSASQAAKDPVNPIVIVLPPKMRGASSIARTPRAAHHLGCIPSIKSK
jgi:hypothetical protein